MFCQNQQRIISTCYSIPNEINRNKLLISNKHLLFTLINYMPVSGVKNHTHRETNMFLGLPSDISTGNLILTRQSLIVSDILRRNEKNLFTHWYGADQLSRNLSLENNTVQGQTSITAQHKTKNPFPLLFGPYVRGWIVK